MEISAYKNEALRSEMPLQAVRGDKDLILQILALAVAQADLMDYLKKVVVYGKEIDYSKVRELAQEVQSGAAFVRHTAHMAPVLAPETIEMNPRLFHAAIGLAGEAGEILSALLHQANGEGLDIDNAAEEAGDCAWYLAVALDEIEKRTTGLTNRPPITPSNVLRMNIRKLEVRYPEKFTLAASEARSYEAEAAAMQKVA